MTRALPPQACLALACVLLIGWLMGAAAGAPIADTLERSVALLETGDVETARTLLTGGPTTKDMGALVLATQGMVELTAGNFPTAETLFRTALEQDPQRLSALWGLSLCLLRQNKAFEGATLADRAASVAPTDPRITALQAYAYMQLDRTGDAANAGKTALEGGEKSPFLLATLAQTYRRMGYAQKALEFGSFAAKTYYGMDFLAKARRVKLPLTMQVLDIPPAITAGTPPAATAPVQRTEMELELPAADGAGAQPIFEIRSPAANATLSGLQRVQIAYRGTQEVKFVVFLVDRVMRGMTTDLPYQFSWDADAVSPGTHTLAARAYDYRGVVVREAAITVVTRTGKVLPESATAEQITALEGRLIGVSMPAPDPLSLFIHLGWWHKDVGETAQAISSFEKAAALDPTADGVLYELAQLYKANGLHAISATGEVYRGTADGRKRVALTFDDGPNPLYTPSLLNELQRYGARGTFFLVGKMAQQYPELAQQLLAEGHEIANHSYTHPNMTKLNQHELIAELLRTRTVLKDITGQQTYLFRPPGGNIDAFVLKQLRALDYNVIYWDVNAGEFRKNAPAEQTALMLGKIKDGSIVLLHNGPVDGTLNILPLLLDELSKRGFSFVTVSELLSGK